MSIGTDPASAPQPTPEELGRYKLFSDLASSLDAMPLTFDQWSEAMQLPDPRISEEIRVLITLLELDSPTYEMYQANLEALGLDRYLLEQENWVPFAAMDLDEQSASPPPRERDILRYSARGFRSSRGAGRD